MHNLIIDISGKQHSFDFPENHSEFSRYHLGVLSRIIENGDDELAYVRMVKDMFKLPKKIWTQLDAEDLFWCEVDEDNNVVMIPELHYLKEPYSNKHNLVRKVGWFRGPQDRLRNISLEQIGFADSFAAQYAKDQTTENLNRLFGALYRLWFLPYHRKLIPLHEFLAKLVSTKTKKLAFLNYRGLMAANVAQYPTVYQGGGERDGTERFAWEGTIQKLAKTGTFGSYYTAKNTKLPKALIHFEMNGLEIKKANKDLKKTQKQ